VIGGPEKVKAGLELLAEKSGADELMLTTMVHDPADRLRSYELVAEVMELEPRATPVIG
jgi:alkanesulfonate monooxygenase SsuD/methylene tetrahydromethanopterin reductase-like flavin-dependent oxidoreductase (luciferase family)